MCIVERKCVRMFCSGEREKHNGFFADGLTLRLSLSTCGGDELVPSFVDGQHCFAHVTFQVTFDAWYIVRGLDGIC